MAINSLQLPSSQALTPSVDWTPLAQLGQVYQKAQAEGAVKDALSQGFDANNPQSLAALATKVLPYNNTMGLSLSQLASTAANTQYQHGRDTIADQWRAQEAARAQQNADRSYGLQEKGFSLQQRAADRADQTPEEKAAERAKAAQAYGIDPNSPEGKQFILTGALPTTTPEQTATQRAAVASKYGIDPATPEGKQFILTGALPDREKSLTSVIEQRKAAATANGLDPNSPGYQSFVLTGKMPREDAQPLTATDKKFIEEADNAVLASQNAIDSLQRAKKLSPQAFSGPGAGGRGYAASFLGESSDLGKAGIATENLTNEVMTNALGQLKSIFGGNPTEGERAILLEMQGSANKSDTVRQDIFNRAIKIAERKRDAMQQRADELRGGTFYKSKGTTQTTSANGVPAPSVGEKRDGYRFKGGDPADPNSWVKATD